MNATRLFVSPIGFHALLIVLSVGSLARAAASSTSSTAATAPTDIVRLSDLVVTATRTERAADEAPGTVTVVDLSDAFAADLRGTLRQETLVIVPFTFSGAGVAAYQRSGSTSINVRGIEGNRVLLQVDGVRVPDEFRLGGSEAIGRDYFDPELFKRVEILQGSASALYGSDALGGVVTFTTKSPEDFGLSASKPFHVSARVGYRSANDSLAASGTVAALTGPVSALAVYSRRDGHEVENNGSVPPNPEDYRSDSLLTKLAWRPAAAHRFELTVEHFDRTSDSALNNREITAGTATTTELALDSRTQRFRLGAGYTFSGGPGRIALFDSLDARLYIQDANTRDIAIERIVYNPLNAANGAFRDRRITTAFNNDTTGFALAAIKTLGSAHRFAYGVEGSLTETNKPWSSVTTTERAGTTFPVEPRMAETETARLGAYLQDEFEHRFPDGRKLTLIPGARIDQFKLTPDNSAAYLAATAGQPAPSFDEIAVSPKLGAVLGLTAKLNAYAQYNRGFRYPTAEDLTATFTNPTARYRTIPNPNLREETSNAYEAGLKGTVARGLTLRLAAFYTDYDDFIEQIVYTGIVDPLWPSGVFQTQNRADARIHGAELWTRFALGELIPDLAGFSLTGSISKSKGTAWGRVDVCECCGSPGRIELHQPGEIEFLQLSAATDCSATTWADCLASLVSDLWIPTPVASTVPTATPLPAAPDHACPLAVGGETLGALLAALGEQDVPVACTLRTAETKHTRSFVPQRVVIDDGVLTTTDFRTTLQLVLPAVASLAVTLDGTDHSLHVVAPTGELLATFHAAPGASHAAVWQAALAAAFPRLR